jgi:hypothetical protein
MVGLKKRIKVSCFTAYSGMPGGIFDVAFFFAAL